MIMDTLTTMFLVPVMVAIMADEMPRLLFEFQGNEAAREWQTVNDGVMGGGSRGRFEISQDKTLRFTGTLSLQNNGGFASVRSKAKRLGLQPGDTLIVRVRGDGREYSLNLYTSEPRMAFSYRATLATKNEEWIEVKLPLTSFRATSFGRWIPNAGEVKPADVTAIGFMLSDKTPGPFHLEIAWIQVQRGQP